MNALEALGYMAVEVNIIHIRNKKPSVVLVKADLYAEGSTLLLLHPEIVADTWEIGWRCETCGGSGFVGSGPANSPHYEESPCPHCEDGIRWETEY